MKFYSVYLGKGRYADMKHPGYWVFGFSTDVLTTDEHFALELHRCYEKKVNRYNPRSEEHTSELQSR